MWTLIILLSVSLPWALSIQGYDSGGDKGGSFSTPYSDVGEDPIGFDDDFKGLSQEWDTSVAESLHMGHGSSNHGNHFEKNGADFYGIKDDGLFSSGKSDYSKSRSGRNSDHWGGYGERGDSTHRDDSLGGGKGYDKTSGRSYSGTAKYGEGSDSEPYGYSDYGSPKDHDHNQGFGAKGGYAEKLGGYIDSHKGGYDSHKGGYDSHKGGYDSQLGGYGSHKGGYDSHKGGYDSHKGGYDSQLGGYDSHKGGYGSHKGGYDSHKGGYDSPKGGYEKSHRPSYKEGHRRKPQEHGYGRNHENRHSRKSQYGRSQSYDKGYTQKDHQEPRSYRKTKGYGGSDHGYSRGTSGRSRYGRGEYHGSPKYGRKMAALPEEEEEEEEKEDMYRKPVDPQPERYEYDSSDYRRVTDYNKDAYDSGDTLDFGPDKGTVIAHSKNRHAKKLTTFGVEYVPERHHPKDIISSYRPQFGKEEDGQKGYGREDVRRTGAYGRDANDDRDPTQGFAHLHPKYY